MPPCSEMVMKMIELLDFNLNHNSKYFNFNNFEAILLDLILIGLKLFRTRVGLGFRPGPSVAQGMGYGLKANQLLMILY